MSSRVVVLMQRDNKSPQRSEEKKSNNDKFQIDLVEIRIENLRNWISFMLLINHRDAWSWLWSGDCSRSQTVVLVGIDTKNLYRAIMTTVSWKSLSVARSRQKSCKGERSLSFSILNVMFTQNHSTNLLLTEISKISSSMSRRWPPGLIISRAFEMINVKNLF